MLLPWIVLLFVLFFAVWGGVHTLRIKARERMSHHHTPVEKF
jgi:hypothetical protein